MAEIMKSVVEYMTVMVFVVMCVAVAFYAENGYYQIGNAKFEAYRRIMLPGLAVLLLAGVFVFLGRWKEKTKPVFSRTDQFVAAYFLLILVSTVCGGYAADAIWGSAGWNMGLLVQISFVLIYFFLSRFGRYYHTLLAVLGAASAVVFGIGILHRLLIDPIGYYEGLTYEQMAQFLSTLGQATWYASFLMVLLPVGCAVFLYSENRLLRILSGVWTALGMASLVSQNSDSAYVAFLAMLLVFLWDAVSRRETMFRYLQLCTAFFGIGRIMGMLMRLRPNPAFEPDVVSQLVLYSVWGLIFFVIGLVLCAAMALGKRKEYPACVFRWIRNAVYVLVGAAVLFSVLILVLGAVGALPGIFEALTQKISYLCWGDEWGNARGRIWTFAAQVFREESLFHKICGVGPDCLNAYVTANYEQELTLLWGEKTLTNAHNEWFTMLITGGVLGLIAYAGIYITQAVRCIRNREKSYLLVGIAAAVASYMAYNFFCYQQILCTPFIFLLMGIGEYLLREETEPKK